MRLRLIQLALPANCREELLAITDPEHIVDASENVLDPDHLTFRLLVETEQSEALLDLLQKHFGNQAGFRLTLLPVEATLPRIEEPSAPDPAKPSPAKRGGGRINREELYEEIATGTRVGRTFIWMTLLSSIVAAIGLYRDDTVVLIGAMVIAPLLTPNMALALSATLGDAALAARALKTNLSGVGLSLLVAVSIGLAFGIDETFPGIAARSTASVPDVLLALASGAAGALAFTTGLPSALIGVMVAVALMPPLVAFGMLLGSGETAAALGPLTLLATNVICVNLAGILTFVAQGVRPRTWWETQRARRATFRSALVWASLLLVLLLIFRFQ